VGFKQGVQAMRRTLATTPIGWALVAWICWDRLPHELPLSWLGVFGASWMLGLGLLRRVTREGSDPQRHYRKVVAVAAMDGAAWGLMLVWLTGRDPLLDAWLGSVVTGVAAINAPVYITIPRTYRAQIGAMWALTMLGWALDPHQTSVMQTAVGLTVFMALLTYYMAAISGRVLGGIQLQLVNSALTEQLRSALALVEQDAATDALTGLPNRRALDQVMQEQVATARRESRPFSVLVLDIDHFKFINDTHGHGVGDDALKAFAKRLREFLREGDLCARYGGEEFVVVLPGTSVHDALEAAERLRRGVADSALLSAPLLAATVSIGVAQFQQGLTPQELLDRADRAVYQAKRSGRNVVRCDETLQPEPTAAAI
jgi:diguanylate cyclase (GGDEF)-like protein